MADVKKISTTYRLRSECKKYMVYAKVQRVPSFSGKADVQRISLETKWRDEGFKFIGSERKMLKEIGELIVAASKLKL